MFRPIFKTVRKFKTLLEQNNDNIFYIHRERERPCPHLCTDNFSECVNLLEKNMMSDLQTFSMKGSLCVCIREDIQAFLHS